jgi:hypothetical protein
MNSVEIRRSEIFDTLFIDNEKIEYNIFENLFDNNIDQYINSLSYDNLLILLEKIKEKEENYGS